MNILSELVLLFFALSFGGVAIFFYKKYATQVEETKTITAKFTQKRAEELLVDLELATSDQLFNELKNRPMMPFLLVRPQEQGVTVESHNIPPVPTAQMLTFAAFIVQKQLTSQGIDFDGPRFMDDNE
jgi:hypothetical protein